MQLRRERSPYPQSAPAREEKNPASHFLSLQCVLDKYQHQNNILCKKVEYLISENKRLKEKTIPDHGHVNATANNQLDYGKRQKNYLFNNRMSCEKEKTVTGLDFKTRSKSRGHVADQKWEMASKRDIYLDDKYLNRKPDLKLRLQNQEIEDGKTERKYSYISKAKGILENRVNQVRKESPRYNYTQMQNQKSYFPYNDQETQRPKRKSARLKTLPEPEAYARKKIFNREVYLERETVLVEEESEEKLPTFIEASFGNLEEIQEPKSSRERLKSIKMPLNVSNKEIESTFKLGRTQNQKKQFPSPIAKIQPVQYRPWQQKQNSEKCSGKKTNYPYIKQDYKLAEPKTQLTKIFYPQRPSQHKQIREKMPTRKTFLHVMSKLPKRSLFSK